MRAIKIGWMIGVIYIVCGGQRIWTVHSTSDLKYTLYIMLEKQRRWEMLVGNPSESHDVLIGKGKLSGAHHVAGQT